MIPPTNQQEHTYLDFADINTLRWLPLLENSRSCAETISWLSYVKNCLLEIEICHVLLWHSHTQPLYSLLWCFLCFFFSIGLCRRVHGFTYLLLLSYCCYYIFCVILLFLFVSFFFGGGGGLVLQWSGSFLIV